jgi:hypothetical protein
MAQPARIPPPRPPGDEQPARGRRRRWYGKPLRSLRQAWRSQTDLWERWYAAPYKDAGPLRWQRRDGTWVLDGTELPKPPKAQQCRH